MHEYSEMSLTTHTLKNLDFGTVNELNIELPAVAFWKMVENSAWAHAAHWSRKESRVSTASETSKKIARNVFSSEIRLLQVGEEPPHMQICRKSSRVRITTPKQFSLSTWNQQTGLRRCWLILSMKIPTSSPDEGTQVPFALLQQHVSAFIHASLPLCLHVMYRAGMYRAARKSNATSTRRTWPSRTLIRGLAMRNDDIFVGHRKLKQSALPISSPRPNRFRYFIFHPQSSTVRFFVHRTTHHQKSRSASVVMSSFAGNWYSSHVAVMTWRRMPIFRRSFSVARLIPLAGRWSWWTQACEFAFPVRTKKLDVLNSTCIFMWGAGEEVRFRLHSFHFCMSESIKGYGRV